MNVQKAEPPLPSATQGHGRSGGRAKAIPKMDQVRQAAMSINTRVDGENKGTSTLYRARGRHMLTNLTGTARAGQHADNHGPDAGAFHACGLPSLEAYWGETCRTCARCVGIECRAPPFSHAIEALPVLHNFNVGSHVEWSPNSANVSVSHQGLLHASRV